MWTVDAGPYSVHAMVCLSVKRNLNNHVRTGNATKSFGYDNNVG